MAEALPALEPADAQCPDCLYLTSAVGHKITCGGGND